MTIIGLTTVLFHQSTSYDKHFTNNNIITKQLNTKERQLRSKLDTCIRTFNEIILEMTARQLLSAFQHIINVKYHNNPPNLIRNFNFMLLAS